MKPLIARLLRNQLVGAVHACLWCCCLQLGLLQAYASFHLPPLVIFSAQLYVCCDNCYFNGDDDSQGTNHKAEAKDVVEVSLHHEQHIGRKLMQLCLERRYLSSCAAQHSSSG